mgnify:CR=1 FL=1
MLHVAGSTYAMEQSITPIFILSLPRSGSTLTQWIIGAHDQVMTVSEPFLALPLVYTTRDTGVIAEYNHASLHRGVRDVIDTLPGGRKAYLEEMANAIRRIYTRLTPDGKRYFLDKTPRYGLIVDENYQAPSFFRHWVTPPRKSCSCFL